MSSPDLYSIMSSPDLMPKWWWRGQDSNLRSPSGRQFYRLLRLTTPAPLQCYRQILRAPSPRGDSNPLTYRLQVGCAAIALLGHFFNFPSQKLNRFAWKSWGAFAANLTPAIPSLIPVEIVLSDQATWTLYYKDEWCKKSSLYLCGFTVAWQSSLLLLSYIL